MSESQLGTARESTSEGAIRRHSGELRQINNDLALERDRLTSIQARVLGLHEDRTPNTVDSPPEPVRQDLEELQYQINQTRELVMQVNTINNALIEL